MSMKLNSKHSYKLSVKRATRRVRKQQQQPQQQHQQQQQIRKSRTICKAHASSKLSQKLQALKNLISPHNEEDIVKPDELFQETADYIVLLRTRVVILQKLIEFYEGSHNPENENALLL